MKPTILIDFTFCLVTFLSFGINAGAVVYLEGCFPVSVLTPPITMNEREANSSGPLSLCNSTCLSLNSTHMGVEQQTYSCYCGGKDLMQGQIDDEHCNVTCISPPLIQTASELPCGGNGTMTVYQIGEPPTERSIERPTVDPAETQASLSTLVTVFFGFALLAILCFVALYWKITRERTERMEALQKAREDKFHFWVKVVTYRPPSTDKNSDVFLIPTVHVDTVQRTTEENDHVAPIVYELPKDPEWEVQREDLVLGERLGQGAFGEVVRAEARNIRGQDKGVTCTVAVKRLKGDHTDVQLRDLLSEMQILKFIGEHKNVIRLLGCCTQNGPPLVILEYAPHGSLIKYLHRLQLAGGFAAKGLTMRHLISLAHQVAEGMKYLASQRFIHRDLAARNVLIGENYVLKIADFGMARDFIADEYYRLHTNTVVPYRWMAPESLSATGVYTFKSDVWSYGVLLWEIMTLGKSPYAGITSIDVLSDRFREGYRLRRPQHCSLEIYDLMRDCWSYVPEARTDFIQLKNNLDRILSSAQNQEYLNLDIPDNSDYVNIVDVSNDLDIMKTSNVSNDSDNMNSLDVLIGSDEMNTLYGPKDPDNMNDVDVLVGSDKMITLDAPKDPDNMNNVDGNRPNEQIRLEPSGYCSNITHPGVQFSATV